MYINEALSQIDSFSEMEPIAQKAQAKLSFWGTRYLYVEGYEGTLDIDAIGARVIEILHRIRCEFTEAERKPGDRLEIKIIQLYDMSFQQIKDANYFTKVLAVIQYIFWGAVELIFKGETTFSQFDVDINFTDALHFAYYTHNQFLEKYGICPEEAKKKGYDVSLKRGSYGWKPALWSAPDNLLPVSRAT